MQDSMIRKSLCPLIRMLNNLMALGSASVYNLICAFQELKIVPYREEKTLCMAIIEKHTKYGKDG